MNSNFRLEELNNLKEDFYASTPKFIKSLFEKCVEFFRRDRPTFKQVKTLQKKKQFKQ